MCCGVPGILIDKDQFMKKKQNQVSVTLDVRAKVIIARGEKKLLR